MRALRVAGALLAALAVLGVAKHCYDGHVADDALLARDLALSRARADSIVALRTADSLALDSLRRVADARHDTTAALAAQVNALSARVRIRAPGVIEVTANAGAGVPHGGPPPIVTVEVPRVVTDMMTRQRELIAAQGREIGTLRDALAKADTALKRERALREEREREAAILDAAAHPLCGRKCGIALGVLATVGAVWLADKVRGHHDYTPGGELRHGVQVGVGVRLWP